MSYCHCVCVGVCFTLPCMSNLRVRVTFMPPSPKSCSQFILAAESGAGSRMKEALEILELFKLRNSAFCCSCCFFCFPFFSFTDLEHNETAKHIRSFSESAYSYLYSIYIELTKSNHNKFI